MRFDIPWSQAIAEILRDDPDSDTIRWSTWKIPSNMNTHKYQMSIELRFDDRINDVSPQLRAATTKLIHVPLNSDF